MFATATSLLRASPLFGGRLRPVVQVCHKSGSHTPSGNFSSKRGNKNFYKGKGGKKYGHADQHGGCCCPH